MIAPTSRRAAAVLLVALAGPWTSSGQGRPAKPAPPPPPTEALDSLAQRLCETLHTLPQKRKDQCCGTSTSGGLATECVRLLSASLRDKAVTLDAADVDRCAADSSRQLEGCNWVTPLMPRTPEACRGILHARLEAGARCRSSLECRDGLFCLGSSPARPGVCAQPSAPGAVCGGGGADTLATYARQTDYETRHPECAGFCLRGRCAAFVASAGACRSNTQCAPGSHCASGRCVEGSPPKLGEACPDTTCAGDAVCVEGKCSPLKKGGEPCTKPFECEASCVIPAGAKTGICGMKCTSWPPAGYTPPVHDSPKPPVEKPTPPQ